MCNIGFNGGLLWLCDTDGANCFICKHTVDITSHFTLDCPSFKDHFVLLWHKLKIKVRNFNPTDGDLKANLVDNLDQHGIHIFSETVMPLRVNNCRHQPSP